MEEQKFIDTNARPWNDLEQFPGTQILPLAEPVPQGSIHRLRMVAGTIIPVHAHPCDEYVYVLEGIIQTKSFLAMLSPYQIFLVLQEVY